jgi:hypothetical protein
MKKGMLYLSSGSRVVVLCTGESEDKHCSYPHFSGVLIQGTGSYYKQGDYSKTWASNAFNQCDEIIEVTGKEWKEMGACVL